MNVVSAPLTTTEARGCIYSCLGAEDPSAAVKGMLGDIGEVTDPDALKIAQYVLMIPPALKGLREYLREPFETFADDDVTLEDIHKGVADKSAGQVIKALRDSPDAALVSQVNKQRVKALVLAGKSTGAIEDVFEVIPRAAQSAALTTTAAAHLVALELQASGEYEGASREAFIEGVKSSGSLQRSLTRLGLGQVTVTHWAMELLADEIIRGKKDVSPNGRNLAAIDGRVTLAKDLQDWRVPSGKIKNQMTNRFEGNNYRLNGSREQASVRIGCLISFAPELVTAYYQQHVDLLERHDQWPRELQLPVH